MIYYRLSQNYPILVKIINKISSFIFRISRLFIRRNKKSTSVAIISLHKMGDSIYTLPAVKRLVNYYKDRIVLITFPENISIYTLLFPEIKYAAIGMKEFMFSGRISGRSPRKKLREIRPEIIYDITGSIRGASLIFNSRASKIAGINDDQFRGIYDVFVPVSYLNHLSEIYTNVTNAMDIPELPESEQEIRMNGNISGNNAALIFPLAGWKAKEWGINNFISLAKKIQNTFKVSFVMPEGSMRTDVINEICSEGLDVIKTKDVPGMINEIKKCSLVISNDSGPSHVAELLGKRVITLFGPTNPAVHKKKSDLTVNIMKIIKCSPVSEKLCFANGGKDCPSNECLLNITVDEVFREL